MLVAEPICNLRSVYVRREGGKFIWRCRSCGSRLVESYPMGELIEVAVTVIQHVDGLWKPDPPPGLIKEVVGILQEVVLKADLTNA